MITEIDVSQFYRCKPLLSESGQLEVAAVIDGVNSGRVFVDCINNPTTALVWLGNNDGFFFIGNEENIAFNEEISNFIDTFIKYEAAKVDLNWFEIIGNHSKWNAIIEKLFHNRQLQSWNQRVYIYEPSTTSESFVHQLNPKYELVSIRDVLLNSQYKIVCEDRFLRTKLLEFWKTTDQFLQLGIGYCIIHRNRVVSLCFSGFVHNHIHVIDIETIEEYRQQGLAKILAAAFVNECILQQQLAYWDVMEENKPSIAVAKSVGFKHVSSYTGYYFKLNH